MKKTRYQPPYTKEGNKTTYPDTIGKSGVYVIKEDGKIVYVGSSGKNLYKTMYRHFEIWNHKTQDVVSYATKLKRKKYTVGLIVCTPKQAYHLEILLIKKHKPRDNWQLYKDYDETKYDEDLQKSYQATKVNTDPLPF